MVAEGVIGDACLRILDIAAVRSTPATLASSHAVLLAEQTRALIGKSNDVLKITEYKASPVVRSLTIEV